MNDVVRGRNLADGWTIAGAAERGAITYKAWVSGRQLPVQRMRVRNNPRTAWYATWRSHNEIGLVVSLMTGRGRARRCTTTRRRCRSGARAVVRVRVLHRRDLPARTRPLGKLRELELQGDRDQRLQAGRPRRWRDGGDRAAARRLVGNLRRSRRDSRAPVLGTSAGGIGRVHKKPSSPPSRHRVRSVPPGLATPRFRGVDSGRAADALPSLNTPRRGVAAGVRRQERQRRKRITDSVCCRAISNMHSPDQGRRSQRGAPAVIRSTRSTTS